MFSCQFYETLKIPLFAEYLWTATFIPFPITFQTIPIIYDVLCVIWLMLHLVDQSEVSSRRRCSSKKKKKKERKTHNKKTVAINFANFTGVHLRHNVILNKVAGCQPATLASTKGIYGKLTNIFQNSFFTEHFWATGFGSLVHSRLNLDFLESFKSRECTS